MSFQTPTSLPQWGLAGVKMIWSSFDQDEDGELSDLEWMQLKVRRPQTLEGSR